VAETRAKGSTGAPIIPGGGDARGDDGDEDDGDAVREAGIEGIDGEDAERWCRESGTASEPCAPPEAPRKW
jgi:hypothetical protein